MGESILISIKKLIGLPAEYDAFDSDIIFGINSQLMTLHQLGLDKNKEAYRITGVAETWNDFLGNSKNLQSVKTCIQLSVKMIFDPPSNSFVMDAMKSRLEQLRWRLMLEVDKEG